MRINDSVDQNFRYDTTNIRYCMDRKDNGNIKILSCTQINNKKGKVR